MNRRQILIGGGALGVAGAGAAFAGWRRMGSMADYDASVGESRAALRERPELGDLIRFATLAANSHNTQPWRFRTSNERIEILPDFLRRTPVVDPDDHHLFASLGCAAENLAIAAGGRGRAGELNFNPANGASVAFVFGGGQAAEPALFDAIPRRQSTRAEYDGKPVSVADLRTLASAAAVPGVDLVLITERPQIERVRDLVVTGNSAQMADAAFITELKSWLRFSPRQAMETGDGLFGAASGVPIVPAWAGPLAFDWFAGVDAENDKYLGHINSSAGIAVFVAEREDKEHWFRAGRACQRFALQATALGLKHTFINQPVEVAKLRPELASLIGMLGRRPDIVMRFGYGPTLPYAARRPLDAVIVQ